MIVDTARTREASSKDENGLAPVRKPVTHDARVTLQGDDLGDHGNEPESRASNERPTRIPDPDVLPDPRDKRSQIVALIEINE